MTPTTPRQAGSRPCSPQRRNDIILHRSDIQMCTFAVRLLADDLRSKQQSLWGSHQRDLLWVSGSDTGSGPTQTGNLIRISQASCCPGTTFFFPAASNYWTVKGRCWAGRRFSPPANEPAQIREKQPTCMETWTPTAGTDLQTCTISGASVSAELESSRMTQDFTWKPDWTFHWLH